MSDTEVRATPERALWTRRFRWLVLACVALVIVLVGSLAVWARMQSLDEDYGPIGSGSSGGTGLSAGIRYDDKDGFGNARLVTTGNRTTTVFGSMSNDGAHSVVVTGIDHDDVTVATQWAPYPEDMSHTPAFAPTTHWRDFPGTIAAHTEVQLRFTIRRPPFCQDKPMQPNSGLFYSDNHVAHWESLLGTHTTAFQGGLSSAFGGGVQIC